MGAPAKKTMALLAVARCMRDELHGPGGHVFDRGAPADGLRVVADGRLFSFQRATPWPKLLVFSGTTTPSATTAASTRRRKYGSTGAARSRTPRSTSFLYRISCILWRSMLYSGRRRPRRRSGPTIYW